MRSPGVIHNIQERMGYTGQGMYVIPLKAFFEQPFASIPFSNILSSQQSRISLFTCIRSAFYSST